MAEPSEPLTESEKCTYAAAAALADLVQDLDRRGLLIGDVRQSVAESLELFRTTRTGDPNRVWHVDLLDLYQELHGHEPEAP